MILEPKVAANHYIVDTGVGIFKRTSARIYTHLLIARRDGEDTWGTLGWTSRHDLALKQIKTWASRMAGIRVYEVATGRRIV